MKPIDNWADAARQLNEDTRNLTKGVQEAFTALQAVLLDMQGRLSLLEHAMQSAADTGWKFAVGDRVRQVEPDPQIMEVTDRFYDAAGTRTYMLDDWLSISDDIIDEQGWEKI